VTSDTRPALLVAGIGGASLGTEVLKALALADRYTVYGCDVSPLAFGHYVDGLAGSFVVDRSSYAESVIDLCRARGIGMIVPGGEATAVALAAAAPALAAAGIQVAGNSAELVAVCSDKARLFERLGSLDACTVPWSLSVQSIDQFEARADVPHPCIVKPATGSGGSRLVFLAESPAESRAYVSLVTSLGYTALVQEYLPLDEGEFTIGVLSLCDGAVYGSVAMQRLFHAKLSVLFETETGLVSSGYSQGLIDDFPHLRAEAERIAAALGSVGPINIQARVRDGALVPFEINPRFSASTYLRAMAGFNEVDIYLRHRLGGDLPPVPAIRPGYYLRSLDQCRVSPAEVRR
jgi:carbamoyl-phosphate synthase large subunit